MQGYVLVDRKLVSSTDREAIGTSMPEIKKQIELRAQRLDATSDDTQFNRVLDEINHLLGIWNANLEFLSYADKLGVIADARILIDQLKWPPDELPPAGSSV